MTLEEFDRLFIYERHRSIDGWALINGPPWKGDCEDYALTQARNAAGSTARFFLELLTFRIMPWWVWSERSLLPSHIVVWRRGSGWFDSNFPGERRFAARRRALPFLFPVTLVMMAVGLVKPY